MAADELSDSKRYFLGAAPPFLIGPYARRSAQVSAISASGIPSHMKYATFLLGCNLTAV
jgi:hypothetical protein